jgi:hypothetical protein
MDRSVRSLIDQGNVRKHQASRLTNFSLISRTLLFDIEKSALDIALNPAGAGGMPWDGDRE